MIHVDKEKCTGCGTCVRTCLRNVMRMEGGHPVINTFRCVGCAVCVDACPTGALADDNPDKMYFVRGND